MERLPEFKGRKFAPLIKTEVETRIAPILEADEILREKIEEIKEEAVKRETRHGFLGEITPNLYVTLQSEKKTKNKIVETLIEKETFAQVLLQLMEEYGASPDRFKLTKTWSLEQREYPTDHEYLIFRSLTLLNKDREVKSIDWDIVCTREPFPLKV